MSTHENVTNYKKGALLCALFVSFVTAGCGSQKAKKLVPLVSDSLFYRYVNTACGERDLPLPLKTTVRGEGRSSGCYTTVLSRDELSDFCKKAYERDGWDLTDFSNSDRFLLVGNKPEKMVVIDGCTLSDTNVFYVSLKRWDAPVSVERAEEPV